ncbi:DUF5793 family protein [Halomarina litorea]|uniref:DUF5793 family protein n=1 Tax=Halomarina litorea TaxID=2961595 RepID=UPI0020C2AE9E|nr:DUF5793 family protein [Halomarina sp. BCD28]
MRRDYFTLDVDTADDDGRPTVTIEFDGPTGPFEERLTDETGSLLDAVQVDVSYRLQAAEMRPEATGVFSLTNRVTGDYVLEANVDAEVVLRLVEAARTGGTDDEDEGGCYRVVVRTTDGERLVHDKSTLLVYDEDGEVIRESSLIPSGVEL